eukprot:4295931-Pyramimonas_sp.AAC.1
MVTSSRYRAVPAHRVRKVLHPALESTQGPRVCSASGPPKGQGSTSSAMTIFNCTTLCPHAFLRQ